MLKLKRSAAWTAPMMVQAALMSAGPLFASEQQSDERVLAEPTVEAVLAASDVTVSDEAVDDEEGDAKVGVKPPVLKARTVKARPTKTEPAEVARVDVVRTKDGTVRAISGGTLILKSADGKTYEIITPGGPPAFLDGPVKEGAPGKPGRAVTILRTDDGENRVLEVDRVDGLINDLTFNIKNKMEAEAPKFIIGVSVSEAPDALMSQLGRDEESAVVVDAVMDESPAAKAGVKKFDVILKAAGEEVATAGELTKAVKSSDGKELEIVLLRAGKEMTVEITPRPNEPVKAKISDGTIHFGPALMERRVMSLAGEPGFGPGPLHEEIKALRKDVAELKKMVEELKAEK